MFKDFNFSIIKKFSAWFWIHTGVRLEELIALISRRIYKSSFVLAASVIIISATGYPVIERYLPDTGTDLERYVKFDRLSEEINKYAKNFNGKLGIIIKDLQTNQLIEINPDELFPSASLVKLPIMAVCFKAQEEGRICLKDELVLKKSHKAYPKTGLYRTRSGKKISVNKLLKAMITHSDNTATNVLSDTFGFKYLNRKFVELGLHKTDIKRGIMELRKRDRGIENYTTPRDMAFFLERIYKGEMVSLEASKQMLDILKEQKINDRIPVYLPNSVVVAHKTGLLRNAVSDVGIVYTRKGDFIICILTSDIRSTKRAKRAIRRIAEYAYDLCYKSET